MTKKPMTAAEKAAHFAALKKALLTDPSAVVARTMRLQEREPPHALGVHKKGTDAWRAVLQRIVAEQDDDFHALVQRLRDLCEGQLQRELPSAAVDALQATLLDIAVAYRAGFEDWWARNNRNPDRPPSALLAARKASSDRGNDNDSKFNYGEDRTPIQEWNAHFAEAYGKPPGNSSANREVRPGELAPRDYPVAPLYDAHDYLRHWFLSHDLTWKPVFPRIDRDTPGGDPDDKSTPTERSQREAVNTAEQSFLAVAQWLDRNYIAENCYTVVTTRKNDRGSAEAKANRQAYQAADRKKRAAKRAAERKPKHTSKPARG